ncbi:hypothetical protein HMPREF9554_01555 [Treponema phagedenis F0421]|uniref:hypothetical protein n=1 Tax=Treponema phagedenis TaxID=162 RepID=UPI0001F63C62|nr:hypothetical protein [Treponema phagedenis]EFW37955.1 hypothetical protein HMPREF9554_01555 [Treponema phagedenis F0421]
MKRIFMYELRRRKNALFLYNSIMLGISLVAIFILFTAKEPFSGVFALWTFITVAALTVIPTVMFVTCSSGHIRDLLYTNESYLMLTVPVRSTHILLGRMLAGLVEFIACFVTASICGIVYFSAWTAVTEKIGRLRFFNMLSGSIKHIFALNYDFLFKSLFIGLCIFCFLGAIIIFVRALTCSFIKKRRIAEFLALIIFIFIVYLVQEFSNWLTIKLNLQVSAYLYVNQHFFDPTLQSYLHRYPAELPIIGSVFLLIIGISFFFASAWLFKHRIEV